MRRLLPFAGALAAALTATAAPPVLDESSIQFAAMAALEDFDYAAQARVELRDQDRARWERLPEAERQAQIAARARALQQQVRALPADGVWTLRGFSRVAVASDDARRLRMTPIVRAIHPIGWRQPRDREQLPDGFVLIVPNQSLLQTAELGEQSWQEVVTQLQSRRRLYTELDLELVAYQGDRYFQAPVVEARYFLDQDRERPLFVIREPRPPEQVVAASPLREGVTLDLAPNHHLDVPGGRLLDPLPPEMPGRECSEEGRRDGHLLLRCERDTPLGAIPMRLRQWFVGGRLVRTEFFAQPALTPDQLARLEHFLSRELDRPANALRWEPRRAVVTWDAAEATRPAGGEPEPFLVVASTDYTL